MGHILNRSCSEPKRIIRSRRLLSVRNHWEREYTFLPHASRGSDYPNDILERSTTLPRLIPLSIGGMENGEIAEDRPVTASKVGYIYDTRMMQHECIPNFHPEQPLRISSIFAKLEEAGCIHQMVHIPCREALQGEVTLVHTQNLWDKVGSFQGVSSPSSFNSFE